LHCQYHYILCLWLDPYYSIKYLWCGFKSVFVFYHFCLEISFIMLFAFEGYLNDIIQHVSCLWVYAHYLIRYLWCGFENVLTFFNIFVQKFEVILLDTFRVALHCQYTYLYVCDICLLFYKTSMVWLRKCLDFFLTFLF
jgi:hypothetical protein